MRFKFKGNYKFTIVSGYSYSNGKNAGLTLNLRAKKYLGTNYSNFRIYPVQENPVRTDISNELNNKIFHPGIYTKLPIIIIQFEESAAGIQFPPVIEDKIVSFSVTNNDKYTEIEFKHAPHIIRTKKNIHLGEWEEENKLPEKEIDNPDFFKIYRDKKWYDIIENFIDATMIDSDLKKNDIRDSIKLANEYLNRIFDSKNKIHTEFLSDKHYKTPEYRDLYSLPTYELFRLNTQKKYNLKVEDEIINNFLNLIYSSGYYIKLCEINKVGLFHNTIGLDQNSNIYFHSQFNTGLAGYPGGISSDLINIIDFFDSKPSQIPYKIINIIDSLINWLEYIQNDNYTFPYTVPTFPANEESFYKCRTGPENISIGGTAEASRSYLRYFKITGNEKYLDLAEKTISSINPSDDYFFFRSYGFLRDGGDDEDDGVSAVFTLKANIELYKITSKEKYKETAVKLGYYLLTWHYWWHTDTLRIQGYVDPMAESFSPRLALWDTLLWCDAYIDLYELTGNDFWLKLSLFCFKLVEKKQNKSTGGITESISFDYLNGLIPVDTENGITSWIIETGNRLLQYALDEPDTNNLFENNVNSSEINISCDIYYEKLNMKKILSYYVRKLPFNLKQFIKKGVRYFYLYRTITDFEENPVFSKPVNIVSETASSSSGHNKNELHKINIVPDNKSKNIKYKMIFNEKFFKTELELKKKIFDIIIIYSPCVQFINEKLEKAEISKRIGNLIREVKINTAGNKEYFINFTLGFPEKMELNNNRIIFEVTNKGRWDICGLLRQEFSIYKK